MAELTADKAADVLATVAPEQAGAIMEQTDTTALTGIVGAMDQDALVDRLPDMSAAKLFELPAALLFEKLTKVPVEQLAFENPPAVDPNLPAPQAVQVTDTLAVYAVQATGELVWGGLVGSPSPIELILGKFTRVLTDVQITIEDVDAAPAGAPALPSSKIVNSMFSTDGDSHARANGHGRPYSGSPARDTADTDARGRRPRRRRHRRHSHRDHRRDRGHRRRRAHIPAAPARRAASAGHILAAGRRPQRSR